MTFSIRLANADDAGTLAALAAATFALACPPASRPEDIADFIATRLSKDSFDGYLADPKAAIILVEANEPSAEQAALAYAMLFDKATQDPEVSAAVEHQDVVELSKFYSLLSSHGSGIGAVLMAACADWASSRGAGHMWLGVNQENARALKFYRKHGFEVAGEKHFTLGGRVEDDYVMVRTL